jgi:uncharacterized membrane protein YgaE (UPF0421/DUF939 family)
MEPIESLSWRERASFYVRVRNRLRSGIYRLWGGWWQILQTAVAACAAWFLALLILGHERPEFAPIAAVISLGLAVGQRGRRVVELTVGVAFGVAIADLLVSVIGVGPVQSGIVVALAMVVAVFLGRGELGVNEAAISAIILMITFQPLETGFLPDRFFEALIRP